MEYYLGINLTQKRKQNNHQWWMQRERGNWVREGVERGTRGVKFEEDEGRENWNPEGKEHLWEELAT